MDTSSQRVAAAVSRIQERDVSKSAVASSHRSCDQLTPALTVSRFGPCGREQRLQVLRPRSDGRFSVRLSAQEGPAIYRLQTRVRYHRGGRAVFHTFHATGPRRHRTNTTPGLQALDRAHLLLRGRRPHTDSRG
jgi:hypothetical protein